MPFVIGISKYWFGKPPSVIYLLQILLLHIVLDLYDVKNQEVLERLDALERVDCISIKACWSDRWLKVIYL